MHIKTKENPPSPKLHPSISHHLLRLDLCWVGPLLNWLPLKGDLLPWWLADVNSLGVATKVDYPPKLVSAKQWLSYNGKKFMVLGSDNMQY